MKLKKNVAAKIIAICLAATMLIGICSASAVTAPKQNGISVGNPVTTAVHSASGGQNSKEETVYVLANADGSVQKIIVSDWLKNPAGANSINDISELDGIENVKGDEAYTMNPNNMRVWDAKGNDIYYQGTTQKALPVDVSISYQLDGKPISAEDLAGKSGRVTIRFSYQNNQKETIEIDGKKETVYVPFVMLTGAVLDNDVFSNVQISNGKLLSDGDRSVVMGFAMPGLQESLNLDKRKLEIPDYVELTADVKDFRLDTTLTVASNDIFNHLDLEDLDAQNLTSAISQLNDAALELVDGSSQLYDGLSALLEKSGELISGIDLLASGAGNLNSGASQLSSGLGELNSNSQNLVGGAKAVFETLLSTAQSQLEAAGVSVPQLTIDNYAAVLDSVLDSLDETTVYDLAYNTALQQVTQAVNAQENEIRVQVEDTVRKQVLEGVLAAAGKAMTAEEYEQACASGLIDADTQAQIASAVSKKMASQEMAETVNSLVSQKKQELIDQNMQSSQVQSQIQAAVESAKNGESSIAVLKQQLDSYQQFYSGLQDYTDGVAQAYAGSKDLAIGSNELKGGSQQLKDGAQQLYDGISSFQSGSSALVDGVSQLKDGGMQLSEGMKQFNEDGIQKITEAFQGDLSQLAARLKALGEVSRSYQNYSGIADGMPGSVKFVYRTASIEKKADEK